MTWPERKLWQSLRKLDCAFRGQAPIGGYFADFAAHGANLVVEVDGGIHERLADVAPRDAERQRWLEGEGYTVLRFTDRQAANDVESCIEAVKQQPALLLDGGGLGGGVPTQPKWDYGMAETPYCAHPLNMAATPPSPTLPPSRRKGE